MGARVIGSIRVHYILASPHERASNLLFVRPGEEDAAGRVQPRKSVRGKVLQWLITGFAVSLALVMGCGAVAHAASEDAVLLLVDTSGSMEGDPLREAQAALRRVIADVPAHREVGLREFSGVDCTGASTRKLVAPGVDNRDQLAAGVDGLVAGGGTPTSAGLAAAVRDLGKEGGTIVLLSDGANDCGGVNLCDLAAQVEGAGETLAVDTVAFGDQADEAELSCVADVTGGAFHTADDVDSLLDALSESVEPNETGVPWGPTAIVIAGVTTGVLASRPSRPWRQRRLVSAKVRVAAHGDASPTRTAPKDVEDQRPTRSVQLVPHPADWTHRIDYERHP